jgi:hypothetical protein
MACTRSLSLSQPQVMRRGVAARVAPMRAVSCARFAPPSVALRSRAPSVRAGSRTAVRVMAMGACCA